MWEVFSYMYCTEASKTSVLLYVGITDCYLKRVNVK